MLPISPFFLLPHGLLRRLHRPSLLQSFLLSRQVQCSHCFRPLLPNPSSSQIFRRSSQILPAFSSSFILLPPWSSLQTQLCCPGFCKWCLPLSLCFPRLTLSCEVWSSKFEVWSSWCVFWFSFCFLFGLMRWWFVFWFSFCFLFGLVRWIVLTNYVSTGPDYLSYRKLSIDHLHFSIDWRGTVCLFVLWFHYDKILEIELIPIVIPLEMLPFQRNFSQKFFSVFIMLF